MARRSRRAPAAPVCHPRAQELLPLLARADLSYEQIAEILSVSDETTRTHLHNIGNKLGGFPRERRLIVAAARERCLLPPSER